MLTRRLSVALFALILAAVASSGSAVAEPPPYDIDRRAQAYFEPRPNAYPTIEVFATDDLISVRIVVRPASWSPSMSIDASTQPTAGQFQIDENLGWATLSATMLANVCVNGSCPPQLIREMTVNLTWTAAPGKPLNDNPGQYKVKYSDPPECIQGMIFHALLRPAVATGSVIVDGTDYTADMTGQGDLARATYRHTDRNC